MLSYLRHRSVLAAPALIVIASLAAVSGWSVSAATSSSTLEYQCPVIVHHDHGLLCNSQFSARDRDVEISAGRALLWFSRGTDTVHRLWLTDGVQVSFTGRNSQPARGQADRAEYRMDQYEIALLGAAALSVNGKELTGERLEYSFSLERVLGKP